MRHVIPISGKDSLATAIFQSTLDSSLSYEFIFNDTGSEYPEVYQWLERIEHQTGWKIKRIGANLQESIKKYGGFLPSQRSRYCTREAKIHPTINYLGKDEAIVYYGMRADEERIGYVPFGGSGIIPKYPLQEHGIGLNQVYEICNKQGLLPPYFHWERLHEAVSIRLKNIVWEDKLAWYQKQILFSGRSRANCFHCFFQRKYEWLWLYETHPELFAKARAMEKEKFSHIQGYSLSNFDSKMERDREICDRVKEVCSIITKAANLTLFEIEQPEISTYSCGLICGK